MMSLARHHDIHQMESHVKRERIPSKDLLHSGLFASHFFDINPDLEPITEPVVVKLFSSKFLNPITAKDERLLVLGLTGSEDGQNRRRKTDFVLVIDRSGSMLYSVNDIVVPGRRRSSPSPSHTPAPAPSPSPSQTPAKIKIRRTKMEMAIEAAKGIFELLDDDEELGIVMFDEIVDIVEEVKPKGAIDRESLFTHLDQIKPRGGTNFGLGLSAALTMIQKCGDKDRNKRVFFLTDATPTVGASADGICKLSEAAFVQSNGRIGVSYCGIGLSFNAATCAELSRAHSTSIYSVSNSVELDDMLTSEFNYLVSPVAFDIRVGISSSDFAIGEVFGGDSDSPHGDSLLEYPTMTASSVGPEGVKGSVLIIHLNPLSAEIPERASIQVTVDWKSIEGNESREEHEYLLNDEQLMLTEKAFALSVYYRTLRQLLPERDLRKEVFTADEIGTLQKLQTFLSSQREEIGVELRNETGLLTQLITKHCAPSPSGPA
jgi:Ca-activated chloride channel family protein